MSVQSLQPKLADLQSDLSDLIKEDEREIDILQKRVHKNRELLAAINGSINANHVREVGKHNLTEIVRSFVKQVGKRAFTAQDVEHYVLTKLPTYPLDKPGLRTVLWNMTKRGELHSVRKGTNRIPAEYQLPNTPFKGVANGRTMFEGFQGVDHGNVSNGS